MLSPSAIHAKVQGVKDRKKRAFEDYCRECAKCAGTLLALQAVCSHSSVIQEGGTIKCLACDRVIDDPSRN